jgi:hypothetical protein
VDLKPNEIWMEDCDIGGGLWKYDGRSKAIKNESDEKKVSLKKHLKKIEIVSDKNDRTFGGTLAAGVVGAVALGPLGAIAGALYGGKRDKETVIYGELSDGKTFVGKCNNDLFPKLLACVTNVASSGVSAASKPRTASKPRASSASVQGYNKEEKEELQQKVADEYDESFYMSILTFFALPLVLWYFEAEVLGFVLIGQAIIIIVVIIAFIWYSLNPD